MKRLKGVRLTKFGLVVSVLVVALVILGYYIAVVSIEIGRINRALDYLYWVAENKHSGMVSTFIEFTESRLHQKLVDLTTLWLITVSVLVLLISLMVIKYKRTYRLTTNIRTFQRLATSVFLIIVLLTPVVNGHIIQDVNRRSVEEASTHYYSKVEMTVPLGSRLNTVDGYIAPHFDGTAEVVYFWVAYYIGFGFPYTNEWLAGGYTVDEYVGNVFYIEWMIYDEVHNKWIYNEIHKEGVSLGGKYAVHAFPYTKALIIYDACDGLFPILSKMCPSLPDQDEALMITIAGGESPYPSNRMGAGFSKLEWSQTGGYTRYWDGNRFPCSIIHDDPYSIEFSNQYYDFTVSGGTGKILSISNNVPTACSTTPETGVHTYPDGMNVLATAYGCEGGYVTYEFYHWLLDDDVAIYDNPYIVTMDTDHTLKAYFKYSSGAGGGGIPPRPYDPP